MDLLETVCVKTATFLPAEQWAFYLDRTDADLLLGETDEFGRMLAILISKLCRSRL
jgi:hypothetical protein